MTAYDSGGGAVDVQFRWGKVSNTPDTWNMFYLNDAAATGTATAWTNVGQSYVFGADGQLSPAVTNVTITGLTVNGNNLGNILLNHGTAGITQFADPNGVAQGHRDQSRRFRSR